MKPDPDEFTILIVCNDPKHPEPATITNFVHDDYPEDSCSIDGRWIQVRPGAQISVHFREPTIGKRSYPKGLNFNRACITHIVPGGVHPLDGREIDRFVYEMSCYRCGRARATYQWRSETLFDALDLTYDAYAVTHGPKGVFCISLTELDAMIRHMSPRGD